MTPDHRFELVKELVIALPTIVFTGWIAYWTSLRDQDRLRVQKYLPFSNTVDGKSVLVSDGEVGVLIVNLSLFPVWISAVGFNTPKTGSFFNSQTRRLKLKKRISSP